MPFTKEDITTTHGQTNREILSAVTAVILIIALVTIVVGVLIIGRRRLYTLSHVSVLDLSFCLKLCFDIIHKLFSKTVKCNVCHAISVTINLSKTCQWSLWNISFELYSRLQVKVQRVITTHIEMQGNRTENYDPSKYDRLS